MVKKILKRALKTMIFHLKAIWQDFLPIFQALSIQIKNFAIIIIRGIPLKASSYFKKF